MHRLIVCCVGLALWASCRPAVEPTAYVGDGLYEGPPPLCFQHRNEARRGTYQSALMVHFNNTCDYPVDCLVYNVVTEQEQHVVVAANGRFHLVVAAGVDAQRFDIELDCQWKG